MKHRILILSLLFVSLLFVSACKDDTEDEPAGINFFGGVVNPNIGSDEGYNLMLQYNKPNLMGLIRFESLYRDIYDFKIGGNGEYTPYTGEQFFLRGIFSDPNRTKLESLLPAYVVVNAIQMLERYELGVYEVSPDVYIENYFGHGYNKITIDANKYFNAVADSVALSSAVRVTNISCGQTISRNQGLTINYTGATAGALVEYVFHRNFFWNQPEDPDSTKTLALKWMEKSTGSLTIDESIMNQLKTGYYSLYIIVYEPKYIPLSNGSEICMLGQTRHEITVKIED